MVIGVARGGLIRLKQFNYIFTANASNQTLRTVVNNAGYSGSGDVVITINSGVDIFSTTTGTAALVPGSFPTGVTVTLINKGYISGAGGSGGYGGGYGARPMTTAPVKVGEELDEAAGDRDLRPAQGVADQSFEAGEARALNGRNVHENVRSTARGLNETITLGRVEPLHSTGCHDGLLKRVSNARRRVGR